MASNEARIPLTVPPPSVTSTLVGETRATCGINAISTSGSSSIVLATAVSRKLAILLALGGLVNAWSGYEWLPLRSTDLYSWCPAAESYRVFRGHGKFLLPRDFIPDGQNVENLPGIQLFGDEATNKEVMGQANQIIGNSSPVPTRSNIDHRLIEMMQRLKAGAINETPPAVSLRSIRIIVDVDKSPFSLHDWLMTLNHPKVSAYAYERLSGRANARFGNSLTGMPYHRTYPTSILYWLLLCAPVILLWKTTTLFDLTLRPNWILFKYYVTDPLGIICCLLEAQADRNPGIRIVSFPFILTLAAFNLVATRIYLEGGITVMSKGRTASTTRRSVSKRVAWFVAMVIQAGTVILVTYSTFLVERREDRRVVSMTRFIMGQLLCANIMTEAFLLLPNIAIKDRDVILSGLTKLAVSFLMFSGGATKVGEAGLGWLDSRYLAMLSMRGRYYSGSTQPFILECIMLYVPGVVRTTGMALVWMLELSSLWSWWHFETYMALWGIFMLGSTFSIGVPFRADIILGPLLRELGAASSLMTTDTDRIVVVITEGLIGVLGIAGILQIFRSQVARNHKNE